ncbi:hypothetical protein VULLAG_LOCUS2165 [Vulpes lagopus]
MGPEEENRLPRVLPCPSAMWLLLEGGGQMLAAADVLLVLNPLADGSQRHPLLLFGYQPPNTRLYHPVLWP